MSLMAPSRPILSHPTLSYMAGCDRVEQLPGSHRRFSYSMETRRHIQLRIYPVVGILFVLIFVNGSCAHGSSQSNEGQGSSQDFDSNNASIISPCGQKEFIMESYYEKHRSLLDSDFQYFVAQALPSGFCGMLPDNLDLVPRLSILKRNLVGEGSHRHLHSHIKINIDTKSIIELPSHSCKIIIIERLPSGVFADPFELQHLHHRGVFKNVAVLGDTNLELPSFLSNRSVVEVHMDVGPNPLSSNKNELESNIELPLHARYQPLDESGYSRIKFGAPDLFVGCSIEKSSHNQSFLFTLNSDDADQESGEIVWSIPAGIKSHAGVVSLVTFITALLSTLLIVLTCIFYSDACMFKTLKQS